MGLIKGFWVFVLRFLWVVWIWIFFISIDCGLLVLVKDCGLLVFVVDCGFSTMGCCFWRWVAEFEGGFVGFGWVTIKVA